MEFRFQIEKECITLHIPKDDVLETYNLSEGDACRLLDELSRSIDGVRKYEKEKDGIQNT